VGLVVTLFLLISISTGFADFSTSLRVTPDRVELGEPVTVTINYSSNNTLLSVTHNGLRQEYTNPPPELRTVPRDSGKYTVRLFQDGNLAAESSFEVAEQGLIRIERRQFAAGEKVSLLIDQQARSYQISILGSEGIRIYRAPLPGILTLTPKLPGNYTIQLVKDGTV